MLTNKKKIFIGICLLLIILNLVNCVFFDGTKLGCFFKCIGNDFYNYGNCKKQRWKV